MLIKRIKAKNYKTYLYLDLDLSVEDEKPIILIGGKNGGGKTTLFSAIYGALYGLKIKDAKVFKELVNASPKNKETMIELELTFTGRVLDQEQTYVMKRTYMLNRANKPVESVSLNMNGIVFTYGTATPTSERKEAETQVNKILKANLPEELSRYFLFDAMEAGKLLEEDQLNHVIKENIENVMGFNKYIQLSRVCEKLQQEAAAERLQQEEERNRYKQYCEELESAKDKLSKLKSNLQECLEYSNANRATYEDLKDGRNAEDTIKLRINHLEESIRNTEEKAGQYKEDTAKIIDSIESQVLIPFLVSKINSELSIVLEKKAEADLDNPDAIDKNLVERIVHKVIEHYNLDFNDEEMLVALILKGDGEESVDEYDFLDKREVDAIRSILNTKSVNLLNQARQSKIQLDSEMESISVNRASISSLLAQVAGGDYKLIEVYEANNKKISDLQVEINSQNNEITRLQNIINGIDIQIQQEPDPRYDTLVKLSPLFDRISDTLLINKKALIEKKMCDYLNTNLYAYEGVIGKVELSESLQNLSFHIFHKAGNEIFLSQLNAGAKQVVIQVLLKVLHELGDYDPPVMIDTVMGVLDKDSRETILENYFPSLADQTILLSTDTEIKTDEEFIRLKPFISKAYTIVRDAEEQKTDVIDNQYFEVEFVED